MKKISSAHDAVALIQDGMSIAIGGFVGIGGAEEVLAALGARYRETGSPRNLTLISPASTGNRQGKGLEHLAQEGLVGRIITSHVGFTPAIAEMIFGNKVECTLMPLGTMLHIIRARAGGKPGILSHVGLGTFVDPRVEGDRGNAITTKNYGEVMQVDGKDYLFYRSPRVDVAIIRATTADERANLTMEKEAIFMDQLSMAQAARSCGGIVIAQVERIAAYGTLKPKDVRVPGVIVDRVVRASPENHKQGYMVDYEPGLSGEVRVPLSSLGALPLDERKICARRAAMELVRDGTVNLGVGFPEGVAAVAAEEGVSDQIILVVESGTYAGVPSGGLLFGSCLSPDAIIEHNYQLDYFDGGGLDLGYLGLAEADQYGNLNVSKFGGRVVGPGGFINISQDARRMVFCGSFTAGGLKVACSNGELKIVNEGRNKKFVEQVAQVTFSGTYAASVGQDVLYITERAVFSLTKEGLVLTEIAPGIDLQRDIFDQMCFRPQVAPDLKTMDARIFHDQPMGLVLDR